MGNLVHKRLLHNTIILIILLTCFLGILFVINTKYQKVNIDEKKIRVEVNSLLYELEQEKTNRNQTSKQKSSMDYSVFSLDGKVLESTISEFVVGKQMDLHRIGRVDSYLVPIQTNAGTQIVLVDCSNIEKSLVTNRVAVQMVIPCLLYIFSVITLIRRYRFEKKEILIPIEDLHNSTKSILTGNLKVPVKYDYDGEIGTLCHDFELMREELADSHEREMQSKEKERAMYASISHDLKTPLATITGYIEQILYGVAQTPEEINEYAQRMLTKAVVLNKLIDDILDHAKSQLNQLSIQKHEIYAVDFFEPLLRGYQVDVMQRNYKFSYELPMNVLLDIDSNRITQVMQNLIDNAMKYGCERPVISIQFSLLTVPMQQLIVHIKDNGRGIEAADLPFIFDMFYRGNKARTCDIPGSGLGLNIAKYIIEQHGGQIECDSIAGVGTTMSFSLPVF